MLESKVESAFREETKRRGGVKELNKKKPKTMAALADIWYKASSFVIFLVRFNSCIFTSRLALVEVEVKSVSSIVLDMVFDHEGIVNLRLSSSESGSVAGICLIPASALAFSLFILRESGFPVGSLCHLNSCRSCE